MKHCMDSESQAVERAIARLHLRRIFAKGNRRLEVRSLAPVSSWRPVAAGWWKKKEACVIGEDVAGNLLLRVCDGTVRIWDRERQEDEVLASSVRGFLSALRAPGETGGFKSAPRLTSACKRPATGRLSSSADVRAGDHWR